MNSPKISVIIPVYNAASYFTRTLERVLRQSSPAHEIIVINDGSTDGTQEILDRYRGRIITKTIKNSGCAAARNEGARLATGDVLAFLDADDLWFRNRLKVMSEYVSKFPGVHFFCSNYLVYSEDHDCIVPHYNYLPNRRDFNFDEPLKQMPFKLLLANNAVGTPSSLVMTKKFFESLNGFDPQRKLVEDLEFFLRAATQTNFVLVSKVLFYKHTYKESMSFDKIKLYEGHKSVLQHVFSIEREFIRKNHLEQHCALSLADVNYILGNLYYENGKRRHALELFWEALRIIIVPSNFLKFLWVISRKTMRFFSRGRLSRKNLRKILRTPS